MATDVEDGFAMLYFRCASIITHLKIVNNQATYQMILHLNVRFYPSIEEGRARDKGTARLLLLWL